MLQQKITTREVYDRQQTDDLGTQARRLFGQLMAPVPTTTVYHRPLHALVNNQLVVDKWVLINQRTNTVICLTTFNGLPGSNFDPVYASRPFDLFDLCQRLRDYQQVPIGRCPLACLDTAALEEDCQWQWIGA